MSEWEDVEAPDVKPVEKDPGIQHVSDDEQEDDDEQEEGGPKLPDGIRKTIIQYAPPANTELPKSNDEVFIHYTAKLLNGTKVGSSHDPIDDPDIPDGEPFSFIIDKRPLEVVYGMELAVQTMRKGEIASFTLAPRFAYDELGVPPKIPPDATIVFEIELLYWVTKVDIFGDYRAVKTVVKASTSQISPGDSMFKEVVLTCKAANHKGEPFEDHQYVQVDHVIGEPDFGTLSRVIDEILKKMVDGEEAQVELSWDCVPGDKRLSRRGGKLDMILHRVFRIEDVSLRQDGSIMKKELSAGDGPGFNPTLTKVTMRVDAATDGSAPLPGFVSTWVGFVIGTGTVCDPLECAARKMRKGEQAELRCSVPKDCNEMQLGLDMRDIQCKKVVFTLSMESVAAAKTEENLPAAEKVEVATTRKAMGAELFKQQRWAMANERYKEVVVMLENEDGLTEKELRLVCELNQAACLLKLQDMHAAKAVCTSVLGNSPGNIKALYRRAAANFGLSNYEAAVEDISKLLELDKSNTEARALLDQVRKARKQYSKAAKSTAGKMFPGWERPTETLSEEQKGPIGKMLAKIARAICGDMDDKDGRLDDAYLPFNKKNGAAFMRHDVALAMHQMSKSRAAAFNDLEASSSATRSAAQPSKCESCCMKMFGSAAEQGGPNKRL